MQETVMPDGGTLKEYFEAKNESELMEKMDIRLRTLQHQGHKLKNRQKIERNQPCPCGSGKKFKKCCIDKLNEGTYRLGEQSPISK